MPAAPDEPPEFIPLAEFAVPAMPAQERLRRYVGRLRGMLRREKSKPFIAATSLKKATLDRLDEVAAPPACGPLLDELDRTARAWLAERPRLSHTKVVVLPPCDENDVVKSWAEQQGHCVLAAPTRAELIAPSAPDLPPLDGDGLLVVPRLETWFLRHRNGLRAVRALLAAIDAQDRPVLVGCGSWAWAYLSKAVGADLILPEAVTFQPFSGERLQHWFAQLAEAGGTHAMRFRLPQTGEDVLGADGGTATSKYLQTLAGRSLGIPWVAWHMWRRSLRSADDAEIAEEAAKVTDKGEGDANRERTLWVAALDEYVLPGAREQTALLVLHALLIHGPLTAEELRLVLPIVGESNIVPVLVKAGFLEREGERFRCRAAAYPAMREGLSAAAMPMGVS